MVGTLVAVGLGISAPTGPQIEIDPVLLDAMKKIARGSPVNSRHYSGDEAQKIMRTALAACGMEW